MNLNAPRYRANEPLQPRPFTIAPGAVGCKRLLGASALKVLLKNASGPYGLGKKAGSHHRCSKDGQAGWGNGYDQTMRGEERHCAAAKQCKPAKHEDQHERV